MEGDELRFLSVKNTSDGQVGAVCLTKDANVEFRTTASRSDTIVFLIPISQLGGIVY